MSVDLQTWAARTERTFRTFPTAVEQELHRFAPLLEARARAHARVRTGAYRQSITARATEGRVALRSTHPAAQVLEEGGAVRGSPYLAVPLGVGPRALSGPRADGPLVGIRTRDGRLFLASRRSGFVELRWRLVDSVQAPATRVLQETIRREAHGVPDAIEDGLRSSLGVS